MATSYRYIAKFSKIKEEPDTVTRTKQLQKTTADLQDHVELDPNLLSSSIVFALIKAYQSLEL
jgi:hypothetical protein